MGDAIAAGAKATLAEAPKSIEKILLMISTEPKNYLPVRGLKDLWP